MKTVEDLRKCLKKALDEANEHGLLVKGPNEPVVEPLPVTDKTTLEKVSRENCDKIVAYEIASKTRRDAPTGALAVKVEGLDKLIKAITGLKKT
jgi:hypothetical protein